MIITKKLKFCKSHYQVKHYTNFGLKVIKITTKSDLDKDHYLIFPPITKNHYYIRTPRGTWNQNKGSYCTPMFKNIIQSSGSPSMGNLPILGRIQYLLQFFVGNPLKPFRFLYHQEILRGQNNNIFTVKNLAGIPN